MIKSFNCKDTQALFEGLNPRRFRNIQTVAEPKLTLLEAAITLEFFRSPPGNRLEALRGDRKGQHGIRINDQWRICFKIKHPAPRDGVLTPLFKLLSFRQPSPQGAENLLGEIQKWRRV